MIAGVRGRILCVLALACGLTVSVVAEEPKRTSPTIAREAAEENARTPAGRRYEVALEAHLDRWLKASLKRCEKDVPRDERLSFEAFVRIGGGGEAEEVICLPETDVSRCVEPDFREAKYPQPPQAPWWVRIGIRLR
jgi:hypothetical protein